MGGQYILSIDQSTAGTKALLFDSRATLIARADCSHRQIIDKQGWVEHDGEEIYHNTIRAARQVIARAGILPEAVRAVGISNQRETGIAWDAGGVPLYNAIVWQCPRGQALCDKIAAEGHGDMVRQASGLRLSPFFTAAKLGWLLQEVPTVQRAARSGRLRLGTIDAWLVYRLTGNHATDYSNASRTQLLNLHTLQWDQRLCDLFGIPMEALPRLMDSDGEFGFTDFEGLFPKPIPICGVLGDSHAALFAQGCLTRGTGKATYGTGSSVMVNTGGEALSASGLVTSLAWRMGGEVSYVLEGNVNYAGGVLQWLAEELGILDSASEAARLATTVADNGGVYLVPAFGGLGAPHWEGEAKAIFYGLSRGTTRAHLARAAEECIAYQVADIVFCLPELPLAALKVDGGPTRDGFLMQLQADILGLKLEVSLMEELSGAGAAFAAGRRAGLYSDYMLAEVRRWNGYQPRMDAAQAAGYYNGWKSAVKTAILGGTV